MDEYLNLRFPEVIKSQTADYTCLQRLGVGGTAETYLMLASAGPLRGQLFAVKVFRRLSKPDWRQNFLNEVKFLQGCSHPAVMRVFDEGLYLDAHPFVVVEYLPNTLANVLRTAPLMMAKMAYAVQLLSALEYLSLPDNTVVHRDIKPANVFIKGGSCVLGDFGLMKRLSVNRELDQELLKASVGPRMPRNYRTPDFVEYYKGGPVPTAKERRLPARAAVRRDVLGDQPAETYDDRRFRRASRVAGLLHRGRTGQAPQGSNRAHAGF